MYLLDTNVFIEASRFYYGFDIAPGFWSWLADPARTGQVASVHAVREELAKGADTLVAWTRDRPDSFWLPESDDVVLAMAQLAAWATDPARSFRQAAIDKFLDSADFRLIAHAMATGSVVVTREQPAPDSKISIKIPDACNAFKVRWTDPFGVYRALGLCLTG